MQHRGQLLTALTGVIMLPALLPAQGIYLNAPQQVTPSPSVPIYLWWERRDIRSVMLRVYRLTKVDFSDGTPQLQKAPRKLVWSKTVTFKPEDYQTVVPVPLLQVGVYTLEAKAGKQSKPAPSTSPACCWSPKKKKSPKRLLIFAADAQTGKPISGCTVRLFDEKGKPVTQGRTDENGLANFARSQEKANIVATAPDGSMAWMQIASYERDRYTVYLYTDRPLYRPNQKVHFKGIVRRFENGDYIPVADKQVQVTIRNPEGTEIAKLTLTTNRFGSFAGGVTLAEKAPLGRYGIVATVDGEQHFAAFEIAEYRKPEFEVKVTTDKPHYVVGDEIKARVKVTYFFGAPVTEGRVRYTVSASPIWWYPFAEEFASWYETTEHYGGEFITRNVITLGKDGTVKFTVPTVTDSK